MIIASSAKNKYVLYSSSSYKKVVNHVHVTVFESYLKRSISLVVTLVQIALGVKRWSLILNTAKHFEK